MFKTKRKLLKEIAKLKIDVVTLFDINTRSFRLLQERDTMYSQLFEKYMQLKGMLNSIYAKQKVQDNEGTGKY